MQQPLSCPNYLTVFRPEAERTENYLKRQGNSFRTIFGTDIENKIVCLSIYSSFTVVFAGDGDDILVSYGE